MIDISMLLVTLLLLYISNAVNSGCPPDSGIYLMLNRNCYPNGSYFHDIFMKQVFPLTCVLPNTTLTTGEWSGPTGSVNCNSSSNSDPLRCNTVTSPNSTLSLYIPDGQVIEPSDDGFYKCCLPTSCSTPGTNIITANIFRWAQIADIAFDLPSNVTVLPQQYTLHAIKTGASTWWPHNKTWYYESDSDSTELTSSSCSGQSGYSCTIGNGVLLHNSNHTYDYTLTVTWNGENITSGVLSQSNNNGDHVYRFNLQYGDDFPHNGTILPPVERNRILTVTAPGFTPSSLTEVNKTATAITVSWSPDPSDADGYVVNVTSDTDTVLRTQQVEGGDQSTVTLKGLRGGTTYNITVRAYQQLLGPASSAISVQTLPVITSINWTLVSSITELNNTQYRIDCHTTTDIDPTTDVYWLVNGVRKNSSIYSSIDALTYNNTLLVYPDPLGVSVNVTCIAMTRGVNYSDTVILQAPSGPPLNVRAFILSADTTKVNWTTLSQTNGYVIELISGAGTRSVLLTTDNEITVQLVPMSYTISVYSYRDLPSVNSTQTVLIYIIPGPVGSVSSIMDTTWAAISWSIPSYIPVAYPIITYEIGYHVLQSDNCSLMNTDSINIQLIQLSNVSSNTASTNITGLTANTCYLFGVRAYTANGYGQWTAIANDTLAITVTITNCMSTITQCVDAATTSNGTVTIGLGTLSGILMILLAVSITVHILMFLNFRYTKIIAIKHTRSDADDDISMKKCEPYDLHQFTKGTDIAMQDCEPYVLSQSTKRIDNVTDRIYDECHPGTADADYI